MWGYITGVILSPRATFGAIAKKQAWQQGLFLIILVGLINGATGYLTGGSWFNLLGSHYPQTELEVETLNQAAQYPVQSFVSALLGLFFLWLVGGLLATAIGRLFHGQGSANGTLAATAFATVPYLIGKPMAALLSLTGKIGVNFSCLVVLATTVWVLVLEFLAVKESLQLNAKQAVGTYLLAGLGCLIALFLIFFIMVFIAAALIMLLLIGAHF